MEPLLMKGSSELERSKIQINTMKKLLFIFICLCNSLLYAQLDIGGDEHLVAIVGVGDDDTIVSPPVNDFPYPTKQELLNIIAEIGYLVGYNVQYIPPQGSDLIAGHKYYTIVESNGENPTPNSLEQRISALENQLTSILDGLNTSHSSSAPNLPSNAVVIPSNSPRPVQIILESSEDMVNWNSANPGTYGASTNERFFRIRAVQDTE